MAIGNNDVRFRERRGRLYERDGVNGFTRLIQINLRAHDEHERDRNREDDEDEEDERAFGLHIGTCFTTFFEG